MSSIPSSAMKHAHAHHDDPPAADKKANTADKKPEASVVEQVSEAVSGAASTVVETVKAHPRTAAAVGATVVAGVAAAIAAPFIGKGEKAKPARKPAKAKSPKKKAD